jgi:hypothetical protein
MGKARVAEVTVAVVAGLAGLAALSYSGLVSAYQWRSSGVGGTREGTTSLIALGLTPLAAGVLAADVLACLVLMVAAVVHTRSRSAAALAAVWASGLLLLASATLSLSTVGLTLMPAAVLGLAAAVAGSLARQ